MPVPRHRLIYDHDGRHPSIYQYEPPLAREQFELVVDEVVGTPIDTLFYFTGDGRTQIYDTQVGELWGHNVDSWQHLVFYRTAKSIRQALAAGLDPMRIVCDRAREKGLCFFASLVVQQSREEPNVTGRCSSFYLDHPEFQIGPASGIVPGSRQAMAFDWAHEPVREERFAIADEVIQEYPVDGIELNLHYLGGYPFFKPSETERNAPLLTDWIRRIRRRMDEVGARQGRFLELAVRIPGAEPACHRIGIDIGLWVREGLVNILCPCGLQTAEHSMQQDLDVSFSVNLARGTGCQVCPALGGTVDSEEHGEGTLPHFRAAATNLWRQQIDGLLLPHFWARWPYSADSYAILRELTHPDVMAWGDKHYFVPTVRPGDRSSEGYFGYRPQLPVDLQAGRAQEVTFSITDDLGRAEAQGRLEEVVLRLRVMGAECEDRYRVRLNGGDLPEELAGKRDLTYYYSGPRYRAGYGYWFDYRLIPPHWPRQGENRVSAQLVHRAADLSVPVVLSEVELMVRYRPGRNWWRWPGRP
jgi:hypothetical protein